MKQFKKGLLRFSIISSLLGLSLCLVGLTVSKGDIKEVLSKDDYTLEETTFEIESFENVSISSDTSNLEIKKSTTPVAYLTYYTDDNEKFTIDVVDQTLIIKEVNNRKWTENITLNISFKNYKTVLYLPDSFDGFIEIESKNELVTIIGFDITKDINIKGSYSEVKLMSVTANNINIKTSYSEVDLSNVEAKNEISLITNNEEIDLSNVKAPKVSAKTSNSEISFSFLESNDIELITSNDDIEGTIKGLLTDYAISIQNKNGESNISESLQGSKSLKVKTSNSEIEIRFIN